MFKKRINYLLFEFEKDEEALTCYYETLARKYKLKVVLTFVSKDLKYWKLACEGTNRAWKNFMWSKETEFTMGNLTGCNRTTFNVKRI